MKMWPMRIATFLILQVVAFALELDQDPKLDYYCGYNWNEANEFCRTACPSGLNKDCPLSPSGRVQSCFQGAGCFNRMETLYWTGVVALMFDAEEHMEKHKVVTIETDSGDTEKEEIVSTALMGDIEKAALERTLISTLQILLDDKLYLSDVDITSQFYDRPCVEAVFPSIWNRGDPSTLALDVTMQITARYIPNAVTVYTDTDLGEIFVNGLERAQDITVQKLTNANPFFNAVTGIAAVAEEDVAESPSGMPSTSPTRDFDQLFETKIDPTPTGSNGIVFSIKTPKGAPSILITGMRFITNFEGLLEYEVYSKLGSWRNFVGKSNEFDLIASGQVTGKGPKTWIDIIQGDDYVGTVTKGNETESVDYIGWKNSYVLGDGGERSFYFTTTKTFLTKEKSPIPILFSSPLDSLSESLRQYSMVKSSKELELYEGDGILDYPWPTDPNGKSPYFRRPRGPIIGFNYDRAPCFPNVNFTGWPCPYVQKTRRPTPRPTRKPTKTPTLYPTPEPTPIPTSQPTIEPAAALNVTEVANITFDSVQPDENEEQENVDDTGSSSLSKYSSGAAKFAWRRWHTVLYLPLLLLSLT